MESEEFVLGPNGWAPNNTQLPVLLYRALVRGEGRGAAQRFEAMFDRHGWPPKWRGALFGAHHYHSAAHEALGVAQGFATLMLGGPDGRMIEVRAGDALVLPVGVVHCQMKASDDFMVVGAYPEGQDADVCRGAPDDGSLERMRAISAPAQTDPVTWRKDWLMLARA